MKLKWKIIFFIQRIKAKLSKKYREGLKQNPEIIREALKMKDDMKELLKDCKIVDFSPELFTTSIDIKKLHEFSKLKDEKK